MTFFELDGCGAEAVLPFSREPLEEIHFAVCACRHIHAVLLTLDGHAEIKRHEAVHQPLKAQKITCRDKASLSG